MRSLYTAALAVILTVPAVASAQGAPYSSPLYAGCGVYSCFTLQGTITPTTVGGTTVYNLLANATLTLLPAAFTSGYDFVPVGYDRFDFFSTPGYSSFFADAGFLPRSYFLSAEAPGVPIVYSYPVPGIRFQPTFSGGGAGISLASLDGRRQAHDDYALVATTTPEPTTLALSMAGIGAVAFVARRRRVS